MGSSDVDLSTGRRAANIQRRFRGGRNRRHAAPSVYPGEDVVGLVDKLGEEVVSCGDLNFLRQLIEPGVIRSAIDWRYPLEQTAGAHRYVETGASRELW